MVLYVLWSGASEKCFVSMGQLGLDAAIDCDQYGGMWKRIKQEQPPKFREPKAEQGTEK